MAIELNDMNTLKKEDIIFYLYNYISIMSLATVNPKLTFRDINKNLMREKYGQQFENETIYYNTIRVFEFFLYKQLYSYKFDSIFPDLKEETISEISLPNSIFVNPNDEKYFSKKQIIKYIRNAVNHNNLNDRELYHIVQSDDKLLLDIHLLKTKPIPFHVQIDMVDFIALEKMIITSQYNPDITVVYHKENINFQCIDLSKELNKIFIRRYNFENKEDDQIITRLFEIMNNGVIDVNKLVEITNNPNDYVDYPLSVSQRIKIEQDIKNFQLDCNIPFNNKLLTYVVNEVVQFGSPKIYGLLFDFFICDHYLGNSDYCLEDFQKDVINYSKGEDIKNNVLNNITKLNDMDFMLYRAWDFDKLVHTALNTYVSYIFDSYLNFDTVKIGGKDISCEKIRNSFVHGRFYLGSFNKYKLFDSQNGRKNESEINWQETIRLSDFVNFCYGTTGKFIENPSINIPIRLNDSKIPNYVSFTKNSARYVCFLEDEFETLNEGFASNVLYKLDKSGITQVDDFNEINFFVEQLDNLPYEIKVKNVDSLTNMKNILNQHTGNKLNKKNWL